MMSESGFLGLDDYRVNAFQRLYFESIVSATLNSPHTNIY